MSRRSELTIVFVLVINIACGMSRAAAQSDTYPRMAAIDQYLMEKNVSLEEYQRPACLCRPDLCSTIQRSGRNGCSVRAETDRVYRALRCQYCYRFARIEIPHASCVVTATTRGDECAVAVECHQTDGARMATKFVAQVWLS